jgi:hypothetical protein
VPNCDAFPVSNPCADGSVANDTAAWFDRLGALGLNGTWGVWAFAGGGLQDENQYGDVLANSSAAQPALTAKGALHRQYATRQLPRPAASAWV